MEWNVFVSVSNRNGVGDEIKSNCLAHLNLHFLCLANSLIHFTRRYFINKYENYLNKLSPKI